MPPNPHDEVLTGELLPVSLRRAEVDERPVRGTWTVHYVTWGWGKGTIEGMDRAAARRLAAELGGQAYTATAQLQANGVVMVGPWERI